ncbi:hypothetical protein PXH59_02665 [Xenorhabdus sp. SF857]|uniref:hypothetical protein n=1 Tax=Xenorhabdus bakwenae TaxID=3026967 RepID=UPI002557DF86|nr:hypothetical protein [Xenorhabdus sp. SF857]WFQ80102.1 hypothetical protein PXH59_02665 [Xenorhabdus sp. SF857]
MTLNNLVLTNTKSSDCPTPLPKGPHAGIDIEPDYWHTSLRNISINNISGGGNDAGLFYVALNLANANKPDDGGPYECSISVDGVNDKCSRGAVEIWGMPVKEPSFIGFISIKNVCSDGAKGNAVVIHDWFASGGIPIYIDGLSVFNWMPLGATDQEKAPMIFTVSESKTFPNSGYPQFGVFKIDNVTLVNNNVDDIISKYAIYTSNNNGFHNSKIKISRILSKIPFISNVFGRIAIDNGGFGLGLKKHISGNVVFNPAEICDYIASTKCTIDLVSPDERFIGQEYKFLIDSGTGDEYLQFNRNGLGIFVNGDRIDGGYFRFFNSSGIVNLTIGKGFLFFKTDGSFVASF